MALSLKALLDEIITLSLKKRVKRHTVAQTFGSRPSSEITYNFCKTTILFYHRVIGRYAGNQGVPGRHHSDRHLSTGPG